MAKQCCNFESSSGTAQRNAAKNRERRRDKAKKQNPPGEQRKVTTWTRADVKKRKKKF